MNEKGQINFEAWSSGQIESKLWLCREFERLNFDRPPVIWTLAGWYGVLGNLLLSRERMKILSIRSLDLDPEAVAIADKLNENWVWQGWRFKAFAADVNKISYKAGEFGDEPDVVINTSTEHFSSDDWFKSIPRGKWVLLQSNDMKFSDHINTVASAEELAQRYPLSQVVFSGDLGFQYPTWAFRRFMLIGKK